MLGNEENLANSAFVAAQIGQAAQPVNGPDKQHRLSATGTELTVRGGCRSVHAPSITRQQLGVLSQIRPDTACDEAAFYAALVSPRL